MFPPKIGRRLFLQMLVANLWHLTIPLRLPKWYNKTQRPNQDASPYVEAMKAEWLSTHSASDVTTITTGGK